MPEPKTCKFCPTPEWCVRHGCTSSDAYSRMKLEELRRRTKEQNDWIDQFEKDLAAAQEPLGVEIDDPWDLYAR